MVHVMCYVYLFVGPPHYGGNIEEVNAVLISDDKDSWKIDVSEFIARHPKYRIKNNLVQFVNSNDCAYIDNNRGSL